jgi:hypothetical protein
LERRGAMARCYRLAGPLTLVSCFVVGVEPRRSSPRRVGDRCRRRRGILARSFTPRELCDAVLRVLDRQPQAS